MGTVTALKAARGRAVEVIIDGVYCCTLSEGLATRWQLRRGRELSEGEVRDIRDAADTERAQKDAYRLLAQRARSRREIETRLAAKGHRDLVVAAVVEQFASAGLLDDVDFARRYVADKRSLQGWGAVRIRRGLEALGVDVETIALALGGDASEADEELERALRLLAAKGALQPPYQDARRRAYQLLLRRGFASEVAYSAVRAWGVDAPSE